MKRVSEPLQMVQIATPGEKPPVGSEFMYFKSDGNLFKKDSAGVETQLNNGAGAINVSQTNVQGIEQVISSSVPTKILGGSTFLNQGTLLDNGGANDLTIRYIGATPKLLLFEWHVIFRENPAGASSDGTLNIVLAKNGVVIAASNSTGAVDASHGDTASGSFLILANQNDTFDTFASRQSGGGNGAVLDVVLISQVQ